jgi:hypothetical protein
LIEPDLFGKPAPTFPDLFIISFQNASASVIPMPEAVISVGSNRPSLFSISLMDFCSLSDAMPRVVQRPVEIARSRAAAPPFQLEPRSYDAFVVVWAKPAILARWRSVFITHRQHAIGYGPSGVPAIIEMKGFRGGIQ